MNTAVTDETQLSKHVATNSEASVSESDSGTDELRLRQIISRSREHRIGAMGTLTLSGLTGLLLWTSFTPVDWGPLAWIALVPFLILAYPPRPTRYMNRIVFTVGFVYWLATLKWMRLGDPTMWFAMIALSAYLALYWPLLLWLVRSATHRSRIPMVLSVPVFLTGLEYLKAHLMTGFAWYNLGHTQHGWIDIIQVSDLFGAYAVSFVVAAVNGGIAQLIPTKALKLFGLCQDADYELIVRQRAQPRVWIPVTVCVGLVAASLIYGASRRSGGEFPAGPRVALIQGNFTATASNDLHKPNEIYKKHRDLTQVAIQEQPDIVIWPEAMYPFGMYTVEEGVTDEQLEELAPGVPAEHWRGRDTQAVFSNLSDAANAALVIGTSVFVARPEDYIVFNSAVFTQPGVGVTNRYDKIHRVPFGEYIPFYDYVPFLQSFTPYRGQFGIEKGASAHRFQYKGAGLIPLICFEDTVPHLVRKIASTSGVNEREGEDILVNLTNDGWFHGSSELDQHLITARFRAIETRTPIVRAVNTGISAIVDGDGVVREPDVFIDLDSRMTGRFPKQSVRDPETGEFYKQLNCALVSNVPLDPRRSVYVAIGDWFAAACLTACLAFVLQGLFLRRKPQHVPELPPHV